MHTALAILFAATTLTPLPVFANPPAPDTETFRLEDLTAGEDKTTVKIEGKKRFGNQFVDDNSFPQIKGPVSETEVTLQLTPNVGLYAWSVQPLDPAIKSGGELYVSAFYNQEVNDKLTVLLGVGRSFNRGFNDIWVFTAGVNYSEFDFTATQSVVDNGPLRQEGDGEDATRIQFGYAPELVKGVVTRGIVTYETGFGLSDIVTGGVEVEVPLSGTWSLRGKFLTPLVKSTFDDRQSALMVGVTRKF